MVQGNGNVGIGTTGPTSMLQIVTPDLTTVGLSVYKNSLKEFSVGRNSAVQTFNAGVAASFNLGQQAGGFPIMEWYNAAGTTGLGVIDTNGNVGIGTLTPTSLLHVTQ